MKEIIASNSEVKKYKNLIKFIMLHIKRPESLEQLYLFAEMLLQKENEKKLEDE